MKEKRLSVIIPVYKGEKFIKENLITIRSEISKYFSSYEIIAVIDGILDDSLKEAKKVKSIKVIGYEKNMGKGFALNYGFKHSTGDYITFLDADLDIHPKQLQNFIPYLSTADIVIGSKRHPFSRLYYPLMRRVLSKGFQIYTTLILGIGLRDTQSGFKVIKREVLDVLSPLILIKRYAFDAELCFLAGKHGFKTVEAPIHLYYKFTGTGINLKQIKGMFFDVLGIRYRYTFLHYYQKRFWEGKE